LSIIDFYDRGWGINPTGTAYIQDDRAYTFEEVGKLSCRIANRLLSLGLPKETKGAVWAGNDVTAWACTLGLWRANMTWIPVNARNSAADNHYILDAFDCEVMFYQSQFSEVIAELRPTLPNILHWVCIDTDTPEAPSLEKWTAGESSERTEVASHTDDVVMLSPTGGTTGMPKGVMNSHRSLQTFIAHYMLACPYGADEGFCRKVGELSEPIYTRLLRIPTIGR
jgi:acyl-CoA synthetase (AMP-forming)/AMP-acid ligase II